MPSRISCLARVGVLLEQPGRLHDHARRAEPALEAVLVPERLLERVEGGAVGHAFDGLDLATVGLDGEHRARLGAGAIDMDGAGAAVARVAADMRAGQPEVVAQEMDEQESRLDVRLVDGAVDGDRDVLGAHRGGASYAYATARSVAWRRALRVSSAAIARLYSTGPRTSPNGRLCAPAAAPAARNRSSDRRVADEDGLGIRRGEWGVRDPGEADPGTLDVAGIVEPHDRGDTDRGEVAHLPFELLVRAAGRGVAGDGSGSRSAPPTARSPFGRCRGRTRALPGRALERRRLRPPDSPRRADGAGRRRGRGTRSKPLRPAGPQASRTRDRHVRRSRRSCPSCGPGDRRSSRSRRAGAGSARGRRPPRGSGDGSREHRWTR